MTNHATHPDIPSAVSEETLPLFARLVGIIAKLRDPNGGCPWDLKQTHESLKPYLIEEAYEAIDAIDHRRAELPSELGDVLLQVLLHAQLGRDAGAFSIDDVLRRLATKLVARHPHVFGTTAVADADEVLKNWEQIKQAEKKSDGQEGILSGVPRALPALLRAQRIGDKVSRVGFDWPNVVEVKEKVQEELGEFLAAAQASNPAHTREEFGDLLFSLVQLGRLMKLDVELVLSEANDKFTRRFEQLEKLAGADLGKLPRERLEQLWVDVKTNEGNLL